MDITNAAPQLLSIAKNLREIISRKCSESGMTVAEWDVLFVLAADPESAAEGMPPIEISKRTLFARGSMREPLKSLEEKGIVKRENVRYGRRVIIKVTPAGQRKIDAILEGLGVDEQFQGIFGRHSKDGAGAFLKLWKFRSDQVLEKMGPRYR